MDWIKQHWLAMLISGYLVVINLITFVQYGWDKRQAKKKKHRIPEKRLHLLTLLGGTLGALAGQRQFRHKTQKKSFQLVFIGTVIIQVLIIVVILYLTWKTQG